MRAQARFFLKLCLTLVQVNVLEVPQAITLILCMAP
jgi:hypothetical protein